MRRQAYSFIFCDDVRREVGGKVSFMGVYGPAVSVEGASSQSISVAVTIDADYGAVFEAPVLEIGVQCDDSSEQRHRFADLPSDAASSDKKPGVLKRLESELPGLNVRSKLLGVMRAEGIKFVRFCDVKAYVDNVEHARVVFFRPATFAVGAEKKAGPSKKAKKALKKVEK